MEDIPPVVVELLLEFPEVEPFTPAVGFPGLIGWLGLVGVPGPEGEIMLGEVVEPGVLDTPLFIEPDVELDPPMVPEPFMPVPLVEPFMPVPVVPPAELALVAPPVVAPAPAAPAPAAPPAAPAPAAWAQRVAVEREMTKRKPVICFMLQRRW